MHNVVVNGAEKQAQHGTLPENHCSHNHQTGKQRDKQQLLGGIVGLVMILGTDELGGYHSASGSQRRKNIDEQTIEHIHQRNAGNRVLSHRGYHYHIRQTHSESQHLFNNKWYN